MKFYGKAHATAQLILDAFEKPDALPQALAPMFLEGHADLPCRKWSWSNQLLVALACTADARGIRQWNECNRRVKTGARAFHILVPITIKKTENKPETTGKEESRVAVIGFKSAPVFRIEDTDGASIETPNNQQFLDALPLIDVARQWGIDVKSYNGTGAAMAGYFQYSSLLPNQTIALGVRNLSTWAHEMIHASDHRLVNLQKTSKVSREIVAEFGGAILLQMLGHDHASDLGGCYEYCKAHADAEKKSLVSVCIELLNRTCNAVANILENAREVAQVVA